MDTGWGTAIQALIVAACTWYMRRGSVKDRENVKRNTSTPEDVAQVEAQLKKLRADFEILRDAYFKSNPVVDHRGPTKGT
jgi:hypothetical protein